MKRLRRSSSVVNGRPSLYKPMFRKLAYEMALLGATDAQMAKVFGVNEKTLEYWKRTKKEFLDEMTRGKVAADAAVANALFSRAVGYSVDEEVLHMFKGEIIRSTVTRHYPPDSWAAYKWLSIRQRELWTDVSHSEHTQTNININKFDFSGLSTEELMLIKKMGLQQLREHVEDSK